MQPLARRTHPRTLDRQQSTIISHLLLLLLMSHWNVFTLLRKICAPHITRIELLASVQSLSAVQETDSPSYGVARNGMIYGCSGGDL
jgi:hypothetical protein